MFDDRGYSKAWRGIIIDREYLLLLFWGYFEGDILGSIILGFNIDWWDEIDDELICKSL